MATTNTDKMERFAFDVFLYTMSKFNIITDIPQSKCSHNIYKQPDFLYTVCSGTIFHQLIWRDTWKPIFEAKFKSRGLKKFKQISAFLEEKWKKMDAAMVTPLDSAVLSLALVNELIQFLYSKNCWLFLNELASLWKNHYFPFQEESDAEKVLSLFYWVHSEDFNLYRNFIDLFIAEYCVSYGTKRVSVLFDLMVKDLPFISKVSSTNTKTGLGEIASRSLKDVTVALRPIERPEALSACSLLENTGLGIRPHEELLRECYSFPLYKEASDKASILSSIEGVSVTPGQSKRHGGLVRSPASSQEQNQSRASRSPEGISRLEQKRQKLRRLKRN